MRLPDQPLRAITNPEAVVAELHRENDALMAQIAAIDARMPSTEELAYLRNRKLADERASWAWQWLRTNVPIIAAVCTALGAAAYWLANHLSFKVAP